MPQGAPGLDSETWEKCSHLPTPRVPHPRRVFVFAARVGLAQSPGLDSETWEKCSHLLTPRVPHPRRVFVFAARVGLAQSPSSSPLSGCPCALFCRQPANPPPPQGGGQPAKQLENERAGDNRMPPLRTSLCRHLHGEQNIGFAPLARPNLYDLRWWVSRLPNWRHGRSALCGKPGFVRPSRSASRARRHWAGRAWASPHPGGDQCGCGPGPSDCWPPIRLVIAAAAANYSNS